mgnify:FL=1
MRVLVTGATGFLGARCMRVLAENGLSPIATGRRAEAAPEGFPFIPADLASSDTLAAVPSVDAVVHCAARSAPWGPRAAFERDNVLATENLLHWAERTGVKRIVHISTPALYFDFKDQIDLHEQAVSSWPINLYAETKAKAEALVQASPLPSTILRPRAIYGPGDTALLPRLQRAIEAGPLPRLRGGRAVTNITHVDDVCRAVLQSLNVPSSDGIYNIAGPEPLRLTELVERIAKAQNLPLRWRSVPLPLVLGAAQLLEATYRGFRLAGEPRFTRYSVGIFGYSLTLNTQRAAEDLGWIAQVPLDEGIEGVLRVAKDRF